MRILLILFSLAVLSLTGCSDEKRSVPILVLATDEGFGTYTGEMLKAEGLNEFIIDSPGSSKINSSYLDQFDLVILAAGSADNDKEKMFERYVKKGGNLIAFLPDSSLAYLFGISGRTGSFSEGIISIDVTTTQGKGLTDKMMQFHGNAERYSTASGKVIASFKSSPDLKAELPAVVINESGKGNAVAFLYNLPQSIVYTRQGNPELAGMETDSINGIRAMDMFTGGWLVPATNTLNQADEQMHLLSNCIRTMLNPYPIPSLWYFPDSLQCLVTLTNDGETRKEKDFEPQFRDIDSAGAKMTIYVMETGDVSGGWAKKWTGRGFEISGHPDNTAEAGDPVWNNVSNVLVNKQKEISDKYGLAMQTIVNHWFVWCGKDSAGNQSFAAQAEIEAAHGIGMDINYAHYDNNSSEGHFLGPQGENQGNFTGSGLPMKFATGKGKVLEIFQHLNNVYDQQYNENHDPQGFFNAFRGLLDRSLDDDIYSYISVKSHNDEYYFSKEPLLKMIEYARSRNVPVWTASDLLDFLKARDNASFRDFKWSGNDLSFRLVSPVNSKHGLSFMLPAESDTKKISEITLNGVKGRIWLRNIRGQEYAFVTVVPGNNYKVSASYKLTSP